jgi:hypothetical protein
MITSRLYGTAIILSLMALAPISTQTNLDGPHVCRLPVEPQNDAVPSAPGLGALPKGCETSTLPWSAPVGHRQPQAADVISSTLLFDLDILDDNARIDRLVNGICRGC